MTSAETQTQFGPAFKENNITIILSSSDYFSPYLGVCIHSIIAHITPQYNYDIVVFEREISADNKARILDISKDYANVSIRFFHVAEAMKEFKFYLNSNRLSQETYYGLLIPYLLPAYEKAVIMDCDMIATTDLANLYNVDLEDNVIGGVNDIVLQGWLNDRKHNDTYAYYTNYLKLKNPYKCFNGGLAVIDFVKYRMKVTKEKISEYINNYQLRVVDQDIFNILLEGQIKLIDFRWNHMIMIKGAITEAIDNAPEDVKAKFMESRKAPYIIHYAGDVKPWNYPEVEFGTVFWLHARQTQFYEIILYRMSVSITENYIIPHNIIYHKGFIGKIFTPERKYKIKSSIKSVFPPGTTRHYYLKKLYFKLRGWKFTE